MTTNDPKYSGQDLIDGTADAPRIYNELKLRIFAAHGFIKSMTTDAPPSSPAIGDAYWIPAGGQDAWSGHDGEIAIFASGWIFMQPKPGMMFMVNDTGATVTTSSSAVTCAIDNRIELTTTADGNITWDCSMGLELVVNLEHDVVLLEPINMVSGRLLSLRINQILGGKTLVFEPGKMYSNNGQISVTGALGAVDHHLFTTAPSTDRVIEVARNLSVVLQP